MKNEQTAINQMESKIMEFFNKSISEIVQKFQTQFLGIPKDNEEIKMKDELLDNINLLKGDSLQMGQSAHQSSNDKEFDTPSFQNLQ